MRKAAFIYIYTYIDVILLICEYVFATKRLIFT